MSNPVAPLNLPAVALSLLQARSPAAEVVSNTGTAASGAVQLIQQESDELARQSAQRSGGAVPRGQFINVVV